MPNYSMTDPSDKIENGAVINGGNFSQLHPNTEILVGKTLTINGGNWVNVKRQPEWEVNGGNWAQIERCTNLHPYFIKLGLTPCDENCSHVVETDTITIDGEVVNTVYHYEDNWV